MVDPLRGPADLVTRLVEAGLAGVTGITRLGSDILLATVLALLVGTDDNDAADEPSADGDSAAEGLPPPESIARGLLEGEGRYNRFDVAHRAGTTPAEARTLWRALGFPQADDDERVFTSADIAALQQAMGLVKAGIVDEVALVELARPLGNLMSRLAAAQTTFISEVLGARIAAGIPAEDPQLPELLAAQARATVGELLPMLELTTMYAWRRHLAAEVERALIPDELTAIGGEEGRPAAVGFVDITGFTRLSRNVDLTELAGLLDRFETAVLDVVVKHGGRVIKNLGDEIMFLIEEPVSAAEAALELLEVFAADETLPPIHAGLAFGDVLYRGGDVYGPVVNIAARLCSLARKDTVRVDQGLADRLAEQSQFALSARPPRHVRGYLQLPSYRLRRAKAQ